MATTTENLGLTLPAGTDRALVSDLNENFQKLDTFAGQATADIQQAQETANAAAPQASTYNKDEVDAAIEEAIKHGGGGTTDYTDLTNKPSINGVVLTGNKTTSDLGIEENVQADWDEADTTAPSYIKNKPNIPSGVVVDTTYDGTSQNAQAGTAVAQAISTKVDKVTGKGLSANDFTNADKTKLDGIESGAEANVQADWAQTDTTADDYIKNKPTIPSPVTVDQTYSATSANAQSGVAVAQAISTKVDKVTGKGLSTNDFSTAEKNKLSGIEQGATKTVIDTALSSTSTNPVQNKAVQAPIARLVDAGAKNLMPLNTVTFLNAGVGGEFSATIPKGNYVLSCNCTATSSTSHLYLFDANHNEILHQPFTNSTDKKINLSLASEAAFARFDSDIQNTISNIMLCTAEDYKISPEFVPYAKTNQELTQDVEPIPRLVDAGTKNLLKIASTSQTINGVTFTVNSDGTVTANGTATAHAVFYLTELQPLSDGLFLSGTPSAGSITSYCMQVRTAAQSVLINEFGDGAITAGTDSTQTYRFCIRIASGYTANNLVFKPMICTADDYSISPEFVPYTPTMRELYEMILALQNGG